MAQPAKINGSVSSATIPLICDRRITDVMRQIATQSKEWIVESFFDLLSVKPLDTITISEITQNAELDRRTFYRHFKAKEDVIRYCIHKEADKCAEAMRRNNNAIDIFTIAQTFFAACNGIKEMLLMLHKQDLLHLFFAELNILIPKYHFQFPVHEMLQVENSDFILAYNIGGLCNLLIKWLDDGCRKPPDQMAEIVVQVFLSVKT
jgi:AcrR family transcriptional regulator